jgi:hypothetical protein
MMLVRLSLKLKLKRLQLRPLRRLLKQLQNQFQSQYQSQSQYRKHQISQLPVSLSQHKRLLLICSVDSVLEVSRL